MTKAPVFAIGDVHGCARELHILLAELPLTPDSTIVFLGDLIDRGNYSQEVVSTVINLSQQYRVVALRGNHEDMFIHFVEDRKTPDAASFVINGGSSTLASYADETGTYEIPEDHLKFILSMPYFYETEDYFFVHAGLPEIPLRDLDPEKHNLHFLWMRHPFLSTNYKWEKTIVHGHTPVVEPDIHMNRINIDTGCVYDGRLTALEVHSRKFFSVGKSQLNEPRIYLREKQSTRIARRFEGSISVEVISGESVRHFQTLNYNEFGLLIWEPAQKGLPPLAVGTKLSGFIGNEEHKRLAFQGTVVRREDRDAQMLYGVKMARVIAADELDRLA